MNDDLNFIFARRSVRRYREGEDVSEELVRDLLEAAMAAPSANCTDPWHFVVVRDRDKLNRIAAALPYGKMLTSAPLGVVVCGDLERAHAGELSYLLQDCSAAIQNLLLAAHALGLGACWLGVHPREDRIEALRTLFCLPSHILPVSAVAVGWPAEIKEARTRYRDEAVHRDVW
ncbi:MAG: nitroreductase family protein [Kiritimatiellaeota bacterium]|nr:nitroreductase family protein [Kiritimatiellota bacterium]